MSRRFLYKCYTCGKEEVYTFNGEPPFIVCPECGGPGNGHVAMQLVKEVTE